MKKLNLLLVIAMLAAALLAAAPQQKLVRLEVINRTGDVINMRLEGAVTGSFYYLTIPYDEIRDALLSPAATFTLVPDLYARTTWACGGVQSRGELIMASNVRLNFVPCNQLPMRTVWYDWNWDGNISSLPEALNELARVPNFGEPTMEKVVYYRQYSAFFWLKIPFGAPGFNPWSAWHLWLRVPSSSLRRRTYCSPNCGFLVLNVWPLWWWSSVHGPAGIFWRYRY